MNRDLISRDRAVEYLNGIADAMSKDFPKGDYAEGYLDGYRKAAYALSRMISEADAQAIAALVREEDNA